MFEYADENDVRLSKQFRFDFFKHLSNLNVACILLVSGLLDKAFAKPPDVDENVSSELLLCTFGGFGFSLVCCLTLLFLVPILVTSRWRESFAAWLAGVASSFAIFFFLYGMFYMVGLTTID